MSFEIDEDTLEAFSQPDFSVQGLMSSISEKKDLSQILQLLVSWRNQNAAKMSTVIKEQTDAVISIAEDVQALHQKVENVSAPMSQLLEEMIAMDLRINEIVSAYAAKVNDDMTIRKFNFQIIYIKAYQSMLELTKELMSRIKHTDPDAALLLQRVINLYINHSSYIKKLDVLAAQPPIKDLMSKLISDMFLMSIETKDVELTKTTVKCAVHLKENDCLKVIICNHIVKPILQPILCDDYLYKLKSDIGKLYNEAFQLLERDFKTLLNRDVINFDFVYECYWPVADELMRENLLSITDAGHPDTFFTNFTETSRFIQRLIDVYGGRSEHNYNSLKDHLTRFSLYVYYEIRHQHCAYVFETSIMHLTASISRTKRLSANDNEKLGQLNTPVSVALNTQLEYMFHERVFLMPLLDQFAKLSMSLLRRYINWITVTFVSKETAIILEDKYSYLQLLCDISYFMDDRVGFKEKNEANLQTKSIYAPAAKAFTLWPVIFYNYEQLEKIKQNVEDKFTKEICDEITAQLKNMFSIPRLYRRTNRSVPTEHSSYVDAAVNIVLKIHNYYDGSDALVKSVCTELIEHIIMSACSALKVVIQELISSINKTESTLRRLKSRNAPTNSADDAAANINSDDYKIRMQVTLDVKHFVAKLKTSLQKENQIQILEELVTLVG